MSTDQTQPRMHPVVQWAGAISALIGALILALNTGIGGWGFVLYLLSNLLLVYSSIRRRSAPDLCMYLGFTGTSALGVFNWLSL